MAARAADRKRVLSLDAAMMWSLEKIPDLTGATIVVTGANSGIGRCAAEELAARGAHVVLACRSAERGEEAAGSMRRRHPKADVAVEPLDLADLASVRSFTDRMAARHPALDVLINNAGVMALPYRQTADGFEMQIGTNHLGHFALTALLLGPLRAAARARVVTVSSIVHRLGKIRLHDLNWEKGYSAWPAYAQSKLANLLFAKELARRAERASLALTSVACHPGYASTSLQTKSAKMKGSTLEERIMELGNGGFAQSAAKGALPTIYAATAEDVRGGDYIGPDGLFGFVGMPTKASTSRRANDAELAARLWDASEALTGVRFDLP